MSTTGWSETPFVPMLRNGAEGADSLNFIGMLGYISSSCKGAGRGEELQHKTSCGSTACCCRAPSRASSSWSAEMQHPEHGPTANPPHWEPGAGLSGGPPRTACAGQGRGSPGEGRPRRWRCSNGIRCPPGSVGGGWLLPGTAAWRWGRISPSSPSCISAPALCPEQLHGEVWRSSASLPAADPTPLLLTMASVISKTSAPAVW